VSEATIVLATVGSAGITIGAAVESVGVVVFEPEAVEGVLFIELERLGNFS